jgi:hypothetical protein
LCRIIDTFPAFLAYWAEAQRKQLDEQVESWASLYMSQWPELLNKQIEDYAGQNLNWRQVARERVFPYLTVRMPAMQAAHQHLLESWQLIQARVREAFAFEADIACVIYVGIGCGAGWATTLNESPALLFGLEAIAECGWSNLGSLRGLIAHETGHLVHYAWRSQHGKPTGSGPWWQLYEEGFAQDCESRLLDPDEVHQARSGRAGDWLAWCRAHQDWLAAEFLRTVNAGRPVTDFFGSWFEIQGYSETGYFLGQAVIQQLEKQLNLQEIALLDEIQAAFQPILEKMAGCLGPHGD